MQSMGSLGPSSFNRHSSCGPDGMSFSQAGGSIPLSGLNAAVSSGAQSHRNGKPAYPAASWHILFCFSAKAVVLRHVCTQAQTGFAGDHIEHRAALESMQFPPLDAEWAPAPVRVHGRRSRPGCCSLLASLPEQKESPLFCRVYRLGSVLEVNPVEAPLVACVWSNF